MQIKNQREICYKCYRPKTSCICEHLINPINTNTKFVILMHPKEFRKTKNGTGHMTNNSLENCELYVGIDFTNHKRVNELLDDKTYEKLSTYDLSGGQIENVSRKYLINKILNQKEFDYNEILNYIKEEIEFKKVDGEFKMGFLK